MVETSMQSITDLVSCSSTVNATRVSIQKSEDTFFTLLALVFRLKMLLCNIFSIDFCLQPPTIYFSFLA